MDFLLNYIILCFALLTPCLAVENTTDSEQQPLIKKREKHYLVEDDPYDVPDQKRDERQISDKPNQPEFKLQAKQANIRPQLKALPIQLKPTVKPLQKAINFHVDTSPQKIPNKIPIILKNTNLPNQVHAMRINMIENIKNNSMPNKDIDLKKKDEDKVINHKKEGENSIPPTIKDEQGPKTEERVIPNKDNHIILDRQSKVTLKKDDRKYLPQTNNQVNVPKYEKKDHIIMPAVNEKVNKQTKNPDTAANTKRKHHYFIDEADPLPAINKIPKHENKGVNNKEDLVRKMLDKIKEIDGVEKKDVSVDQTNGGPDITQIFNGTHLITIKKISKQDSRILQELLSQEVESQNNSRIIIQRPLLPTNELNISPPFEGGAIETIGLPVTTLISDNNIKEYYIDLTRTDADQAHCTDPKDYFSKINHNYKGFEERNPILATVLAHNTYDDGSLQARNAQLLQNFNFNPYFPNMIEQNKPYYDELRNNANVEMLEINNSPYPEYGQSCNQNVNQLIYNSLCPNQPSLGDSCVEPQTENALDKIRRLWKDSEIKIGNSITNDDPCIDIRRTVQLPYVNQACGLNAYYNNLNNLAPIYPYLNQQYLG